MSHVDMKAFHDTRAAPVETMELQSSRSIPEFLPILAEQAGLGAFLSTNHSGVYTYENGVITAHKVSEQGCTLRG